MYIYIYIYIQREREREIDRCSASWAKGGRSAWTLCASAAGRAAGGPRLVLWRSADQPGAARRIRMSKNTDSLHSRARMQSQEWRRQKRLRTRGTLIIQKMSRNSMPMLAQRICTSICQIQNLDGPTTVSCFWKTQDVDRLGGKRICSAGPPTRDPRSSTCGHGTRSDIGQSA